ncbi:MAG TPA: 30S ribosomal protein S18 [Candidatus Saccharimonadales bacterium]|nr:30S ribosomal protein S18 [Candidatus Saccharimonadales bacterium]
MQQERNRIQRGKKVCYFCKEEETPDYKDVVTLKRYISERGKIVNRARTGVCYKHQRGLSNAIKRSRYMALLPFSVSVR